MVTSRPDDPEQKVLFHEGYAVEVAAGQPMNVELLYGDHLGGQHAIVRIALRPVGEDRWLATVVRHWNLAEADPR